MAPKATAIRPVFKLGKQTYLLGLWWSTLTETGRRARKQALERGLELDFSYMAFTALEGQAYAGFTNETPRNRRVKALAPAVAGAHQGFWVGYFQLDENRAWVVTSNRGVVSPEGDAVGPTEEMSALFSDIVAEDEEWEGERFDTPQAAIEEIERCLKATKRLPKILPLTASSALIPIPWKLLVRYVLPAVVIIAGLIYYHHHNAAVAAHKAKIKRRKAIIAQIRKERRQARNSGPWTVLPKPSALLAMCQSNYARTPKFYKGWRLTRWRCTPVSIHAHYVAGPGATADSAPPGQLSSDASSVNESWQSPQLAGDKEKPHNGPEELRRLYTFFQGLHWSLTVGAKKSHKPVIAGTKHAKKNKLKNHRALSAHVSASIAPFFLGPALDAASGFRLKRISLRFKGQTGVMADTQSGGAIWKLTGVFYEKKH